MIKNKKIKNQGGMMVMKFMCNRAELAQKLAVVSRATTGLGTLPVLGGIKITAANGATQDVITLEATNLEMTVRVEFGGAEIRILKVGQAVVHGKILADAIKKMPGHVVEITIDDQKATIEAGQGNGKTCKCNLPVFSIEEFPETLKDIIMVLNTDDTFEITTKAFGDALKKVSYATLKDGADNRPFMSAIQVSTDGERLKLVGTDVARLAIYQVPLDINNAGDVSFLSPVKALKEIETIFGKNDSLSISIGRQDMLVRALYENGNALLSARLLDNQYPDYTKVIPKNIVGRVKINRINFINTLERVHLITNEVLLSIKNIPYQTILVAGQEQDRGSIFDEISVAELDGADMKIGFTIRFLLDYLKTIDCEMVEMRYQGQTKPVAFENIDGDKQYIYIAMPVSVAESTLALVA
jgi:DNA polymerase-3 subunit beta